MISVLILTKNEENNILGCLNSVNWCDDIHVFDSFSDDQTVELARKSGARVTQRKFDGYASQRNAALTSLDYKYSWLLILDADERVPEELYATMINTLQKTSGKTAGFRIRRRDYLGKKWLKHSQMTAFYIRLIRVGRARYQREINEVLEVDGIVQDLDSYFEHYPFSKGFHHWLAKHNTYSSMEAERWVYENDGNVQFSLKKALFCTDFSEKRYHQKGLFYKMPFRPLMKWLYLVFFKKAFLDGYEGMTNATLQAIYEYFIVLKSKELLLKKY